MSNVPVLQAFVATQMGDYPFAVAFSAPSRSAHWPLVQMLCERHALVQMYGKAMLAFFGLKPEQLRALSTILQLAYHWTGVFLFVDGMHDALYR